MSQGKVYHVERLSVAEQSALTAAIASYSSNENKQKVEFLYGHALHTGATHADALAQAIRMTR
jgi:hypothetical protein